MTDERISVLASLDANPPPKKRKKRGLAKSTIIVLSITVVLFAGVIYLTLTQQASEPSVAEAPAPQPVASHPPAPELASAPANTPDEAPSLSLSALAASGPSAEVSTPVSAVIENLPPGTLHNPIAMLQESNVPEKVAADKPNATGRGTQANLLKALTAPENAATAQKQKPAKISASSSAASASAAKSPRPPAAEKAAGQTPTHAARASAPKAAPVDSDVVLLEGLLASSNREEAKRRASTKPKAKAADEETAVEKTAP